MKEEKKESCCGGSCEVEKTLSNGGEGKEITTLRVQGMDCSDEVALVEKALGKLSGVKKLSVNLMSGTARINHDETVDAGKLIKALAAVRLSATEETSAAPRKIDDDGSNKGELLSVLISGAATAIGLLLRWTETLEPWGQKAAFIVAIISGAWFIFPKAIRAALRFQPDMNLLMTVAVIGAGAIGEWAEGASVAFLFALSELLESFSVFRARKAVQSLLALTPDTALVKRGKELQEVDVKEVLVGETIAIRSGARVPLDGEVIEGLSTINQAPITGESVPVEKKAGDTVFAGTINGEGSLQVKVSKASGDTTLSRIIKLVEEAQAQKAPSQRFVDTFAKYYTPAVMVLALLVFLVPPLLFSGAWAVWTYRALVLLVIACPCALVISTPVSIVSGLTAMAKRGVLIKGGAHLEAVGKLKALAVDKTGTITEGKPAVTKVTTLGGDEKAVVQIAAAIDSHSDHPLAKAVLRYAKEKGIEPSESTDYQAKTGRGAEGKINGEVYFVGNHRLTEELGLSTPEVQERLSRIEAEAQSVVIVGRKPGASTVGQVLGIISIGDAVRANAATAVKSLHELGVRIVMLSGDNQKTVDAIAKKVGIDDAKGNLLPEDKIARVQELLKEHRFVGMIGDGVNDAPAMAAATVGIAMGAAGTDTAIETADIALMEDDLMKVSETIQLGQRTERIIKTNIGFALGLKAVFLVLALFGKASLWLAILADTGATLLVIANSLRLLSHRDQR
jgi:Cd2+/Zn2+-exporting ATPase